jgi:hypothetical protein
MKYQQKMTRFEKRDLHSKILEESLHGEGLYIYENRSAEADLTLPKPTKSGKRIIGPKEQFQGDNYFMQLVRTGNLRFIKEIQAPINLKEVKMNEEKLILDQPETVTTEGTIERVAPASKPIPVAPLSENGKIKSENPVLINEDPLDDGFVIIEG